MQNTICAYCGGTVYPAPGPPLMNSFNLVFCSWACMGQHNQEFAIAQHEEGLIQRPDPPNVHDPL